MKRSPKRRWTRANYVVMLAFLLAAGLGAWGAVRDRSSVPPTETTTYTLPANIPQDAAVNVPVTDVLRTPETTEPEPQTEPQTEPESHFALPLGSFIAKDYSGDNVVYSNTMRDWRVHTGIDFGDNRGQSVLAISDGTVTDVREDALWGVVLTIDHGDGIVAKYCGLEKGTTPQPDDTVERGVVIGKLGEIPIESKDGPHLHLEVTRDGKLIDPWKLLRDAGDTAS